MQFEKRSGCIERFHIDIETCGALVELCSGGLIHGRILFQRQIMRTVSACTREAETLDAGGDRVWQAQGVIQLPLMMLARVRSKSVLHLQQRPGMGGRIMSIDFEWVETVETQMLQEPVGTAFLDNIGALVNAAPIHNHDRHDIAAVRGAPPSRGPVTASLLLKRAVAQKYGKALARQRHVDILNLGKTEVTTFRNPPRSMNV